MKEDTRVNYSNNNVILFLTNRVNDMKKSQIGILIKVIEYLVSNHKSEF